MKALHLINGEFYAGAERVQDTLAQALPALGCTVDFVCLKEGVFGRSRHAREARVSVTPMQSRVDLRPGVRIARLLREGNYDLLHTHTPRTALLGSLAARLARRPMVHHIHGPTSISRGTALLDLGNRVVEHMGMARAQRVIVVSRRLAATLEQRGVDRRRIRVIANGVPINRTPVRRQQNDGRWWVGVVALFRPRKGLEVVLDALHILRQRGYDVGLRAVGSFESTAYQQSVLARAQELGIEDCVQWVGFAQDVRTELAHMHLFAFPSVLGEGMPMALLEAMSAGLPVVASRVEGVDEVLDPQGAGLLVEPGVAASLADGIASLIDSPEAAGAMGDEARRRQVSSYSDEAMARSVLGVYQQVLVAHRANTTLVTSGSD